MCLCPEAPVCGGGAQYIVQEIPSVTSAVRLEQAEKEVGFKLQVRPRALMAIYIPVCAPAATCAYVECAQLMGIVDRLPEIFFGKPRRARGASSYAARGWRYAFPIWAPH